MTYGCGSYACKECYPYQYACEMCDDRFPTPVANGEHYVCENCDWATDEVVA